MSPKLTSVAEHRMAPSFLQPEYEWERRAQEMLARDLSQAGSVVVFVGAGCSAPLGYPTWQAFASHLVKETSRMLRASRSDDEVRSCQSRVDQYLRDLSSGRVPATEILVHLSMCQRIWKQFGREAHYRSLLRKYFEDLRAKTAKARLAEEENPYNALLDLPVDRFITSNYDLELDLALARRTGLDFEQFLLEKSISPGMKREKMLAAFPFAGLETNRNSVFHCHGRCDVPETMVITEQDYQGLYMNPSPDERTLAFRQTMELTLASNPILFVGFGLRDEDLLLALRVLSASEPHNRPFRHLYALLDRSEAPDTYRAELRERYGVNVVTYSGTAKDNRVRGRKLSRALKLVAKRASEAAETLLSKPKMRHVPPRRRPPGPCLPEELEDLQVPEANGSVAQAFEVFLRERVKDDRGGIFGIVGPAGAGKTSVACQIAKAPRDTSEGVAGVFYWRSRYSHDPMTGLESFLDYVSLPPAASPGSDSRLFRLRRALDSGTYILIIDDLDRLLFTDKNDVPTAGSAAVRELLEVLAGEHKSVVILLTRSWPKELPTDKSRDAGTRADTEEAASNAIVEVANVLGLSAEEARQGIFSDPAFLRPQCRPLIQDLVALLDGHRFGLSLVARMSKIDDPRHAAGPLRKLRNAVLEAPAEQRLLRLIRYCIAECDRICLEAGYSSTAAGDLLSHLSLFFGWEEENTILDTYPAESKLRKTVLRKILQQLVDCGLVHRAPKKDGYRLNLTIKECILMESQGVSAADAIPNYQLSGYSSGSTAVDPGNRATCDRAIQAFKRLLTGTPDLARCRSAFGLLRSRMSANGVPRWNNYHTFLNMLIALADAVRKATPEKGWTFADLHHRQACESENAVLDGSELAWLYNELGLTSLSCGNIMDAVHFWRLGHDINIVLDIEGHAHAFQSLCNLGLACIQRGELSIAQHYLSRAQKDATAAREGDHIGRLTGYLAIAAYLRGDLVYAEESFEASIKSAREFSNRRAESIFSRHLARLFIRVNRFEEAETLLQSSRARAEMGRYPDLVAYTQLVLGQLRRSQRHLAQAMPEFNASLQAARRYGMKALEVEALIELALAFRDFGDAEAARRKAMTAVRLAHENGLGLLQTYGLFVLGDTSALSGTKDIGEEYVRLSMDLARKQNYLLIHQMAENWSQRPTAIS